MKNSLSQNSPAFKKIPPGMTRLLDNHFDKNIHEKPWISPGWTPEYKYNYNVTGLGFIMEKGRALKNLVERHELQEQVKNLSKFRNFLEYENIQANEIIVTIEYCTNCKNHINTTRHDEEKYQNFATSLKKAILNQYPIIKVLLKPLLFDENETTVDTIYLRSRIGAFEVQLCSRNSTQIIKETIFSKLETKAWPLFENLLEKLAIYMPKQNLHIVLVDPNFDADNANEGEGEDQDPNKKNPKLKGIKVVLRNYKMNIQSPLAINDNNESNLQASDLLIGMMDEHMNTGKSPGFFNATATNGGTSRPASTQRPISSYSLASSKSFSTTGLTKFNLSQSNNGHIRTRQFTIRSATRRNHNSQRIYHQETDEKGNVIFKDLPKDIYMCEIIENKDYLAESQMLNLIELSDAQYGEDTLQVQINLREQTMSFCCVQLQYQTNIVSEAMVSITKKIQSPDSKTAMLKEKDIRSGKYEFLIAPGEYVLTILKSGYKELSKEILAQKGSNNFIIEMELNDGSQTQATDIQKPKERANRPISAFGATTKSIALPNLKDENELGNLNVKFKNTKNDEISENIVQSPSNNEFQSKKDSKDLGKQEVRRSALVKKNEIEVIDRETNKPIKGALVKIQEIEFNGHTDDEGKCLFPINKMNKGTIEILHDSYYVLKNEYGDNTSLDLKANPTNKLFLISRPEAIDDIHVKIHTNNLSKNSLNVYVLSPEGQNTGNYLKLDTGNVCVKFTNIKQMQGLYRIIAHITDPNNLNQQNIKVIIAKYDQYDCIPIPKVFPNQISKNGDIHWDLGFFQFPSPQFFELNAYSPKAIDTLTYFLKEYQLLLNFLKNSNKKIDLKTIISSGSKKQYRSTIDDDIIVTRKQIYEGLKNYVFEEKNIDHILSSALIDADNYSYKELERKLKNLNPPFNFVNLESQEYNQKNKRNGKDLDEENDDDEDVEYIE